GVGGAAEVDVEVLVLLTAAVAVDRDRDRLRERFAGFEGQRPGLGHIVAVGGGGRAGGSGGGGGDLLAGVGREGHGETDRFRAGVALGDGHVVDADVRGVGGREVLGVEQHRDGPGEGVIDRGHVGEAVAVEVIHGQGYRRGADGEVL